MRRGDIIVLRERTPRYTAAIACEAWMEIAERSRRMVAFAEAELLTSFAGGDVVRLRRLQALHADASEVVAQGRRMAGWADATACADGQRSPGHGAAA